MAEEINDIPETLKKLGFSLDTRVHALRALGRQDTSSARNVLIVPTLELPFYDPTKEGDYITTVGYDPESHTITIGTEKGDHATLEVSVETGMVKHTGLPRFPRGTVKTDDPLTYEPERNVIAEVQGREPKRVPARFVSEPLDPVEGKQRLKVVIYRHGTELVEEETVTLPPGFDLRTIQSPHLGSGYMRVEDVHGKKGARVGFHYGLEHAQAMLVHLTSNGIDKPDQRDLYGYDFSPRWKGTSNTLQGLLNRMMWLWVSPTECRQAGATDIKIGEDSLRVYGPDRQGNYLLVGDDQEMIYLSDGRVELTEQSRTRGTITTLSGRPETGGLELTVKYREREGGAVGQRKFGVSLLLGNKDPDKAFSVSAKDM
ncbi:hypothetical protein J4410_02945 [Candidatus Woesearchaeota archaeon]|nr:hypothetical protein [Candidatus Woesearchaeota archaeon]